MFTLDAQMFCAAPVPASASVCPQGLPIGSEPPALQAQGRRPSFGCPSSRPCPPRLRAAIRDVSGPPQPPASSPSFPAAPSSASYPLKCSPSAPGTRSIIWTLALFAQQEQGPGVAAHTPRRIALKWEPLRTVREEPLALSRNTEVYWPVYREGRPPGVSLGTASLQGHPHSTCPRTWSQGLAGLALKPSASDPYSSAFSAAPWAPPVPRGSLWFTCLGASPCSGPESSRVKQASLLHAELVRAPQWGVRVVLPHRPGQRPI